MNSGNTLPGKIVISKLMEHECFIYIDSDIPKSSFKERNDDDLKYGVFSWLNTRDAFIGTEVIDRSNRNQHRSSIVEFDLSGKLVDRIYEAHAGEIAWPLYSSWDDKYVLLTTFWNVDSNKKYPFEGLTPMLSLVIMDLEQKIVIKRIDSIGRSPNFQVEESPWLHEGYRFVYSIYDKPQLRTNGIIINPVGAGSAGVYVYDVTSGARKLLVSGGRSAIASPTVNQIAYEKDNSIRLLDLNTSKEKTIYKYGTKENVRGMHWTPDGKYIYFAYTYHWGIGDFFHTGEKLIEVSTGKDKLFRETGLGFNSYTWK